MIVDQTRDRPHAEFRDLRPGAGLKWWTDYLERHGADVARRAAEARVIYWYPGAAMPLDLFSYLREASGCYDLARFLGTVALASALIEAILNRDSRMLHRNELRRIDGWILLNNQNLIAAADAGLPVRELLDVGENLADAAPVRFVELRNKVAHGDLTDFPDHLSDYSPTFEAAARAQLGKASRFLVAWFNTCPDIQNGAAKDE